MSDLTAHVIETLAREGVDASIRDGALHLPQQGPRRAGAATVAPVPIPLLQDADDAAAWARGLAAGWRYRTMPDAQRHTSFEDAARSVVARPDRPTFAAGHAAAGTPAVHAAPLAPGLSLYFVVEVDAGERFLGAEEVAAWGVSADRLERAAASLLFHRSRGCACEAVDGEPLVQRLCSGDGHDAARALIFDAIEPFRALDGVLLAMPEHGTLWIANPSDGDVLRKLLHARRDRGERLLHGDLVAWQRGRFVTGVPALH